MREKFEKLKTIGDILYIDAKYYSGDNFTGVQLPGYCTDNLVLERNAFLALKEAYLVLRKLNLTFKIFDAYRPIKAIEFFYQWSTNGKENVDLKKRFYPDFNKETLFKEGFIAMYSSHARGAAIDLSLCDLNGVDLDMGTEFDFFGEKSYTKNSLITQTQQNNRNLLLQVMENAGFVNFEQEWWHFKFKNETFPETYFDFDVV
jgi:D-alanyl-D-alanine dipeptidase